MATFGGASIFGRAVKVSTVRDPVERQENGYSGLNGVESLSLGSRGGTSTVTGLLTGESAMAGVPHVRGVRLDSGEELLADLVVDARGPRSSSDDWLAAVGAGPVAEELHESGIVYFSRFYRMGDAAARPPSFAIAAADLGYLKFAIFMGDNDTFSVTYAVDRDDEWLRRRLADSDVFEAVAREIPGIAPWRAEGAAEPITGVQVMAGLRNRFRPLVGADGSPLVHGFVAVGDAAVCTNPLYGRGCTLAIVHAYGLADALREYGADLDASARSFAAFTDREVVPWFRSAVVQDAQARAMQDAAGADLAPDDPRAFMREVFRDGLLPAVRTSPVVFRAFVRWFNLLATPESLMQDPAVVADVMAAYQDRENRPEPPPAGPGRDELLAAIA